MIDTLNAWSNKNLKNNNKQLDRIKSIKHVKRKCVFHYLQTLKETIIDIRNTIISVMEDREQSDKNANQFSNTCLHMRDNEIYNEKLNKYYWGFFALIVVRYAEDKNNILQ